ncbi:MAG: hypothetical protein MUC76_11065 [Spirochaetes bacterium]|jgi:hypothetical protein|nr:hypothetical protein [Spirochaetota bacterium]
MRNRPEEKSSHALRALSLGVFLASALTFALPREYFDPHPGVGLDIFCKSLTFMSAVLQDADSAVEGGPAKVGEVDDFRINFTLVTPLVFKAIRAPPVKTARI